ncbi:DsbA family oxidoreductase [Jiangella asiatica]|uniref:DsbA family oxidoreductase n=1 Tax=Jiangella asiatica TaxID=2530372 RepID=A0A4R5CK24_9ACTN|nr:DsbA family oxidoreductase [Jiangella asiatica]TDD97764.1 DsbA family oxidoreductase [Jiangella asiatica]
MLVEVWSDFVCPWCYIGKRRLEAALTRFDHARDVEILWRSYQLDPTVPPGADGLVRDHLARKLGATAEQVRAMNDRVASLAAAEGLEYHLERAHIANTFDAHRVAHLAREHHLGPQAHERFMRAHLVETEHLADPETVIRLAAEVGVPADEVRRVLAGDDHADDVRAEIDLARQFGAGGVPFFVLGRTHGVSGAQPVETFLAALEDAYGLAVARIS